MKSHLYILLLVLALPFTGVTQNDSIINKEAKNFKNQIDLDMELLAFSFGYKRRVHKNWFVGPSLGFGLSYHFIYENKTLIFSSPIATEVLHIGVDFKYYKTDKLHFELEPKLTIFLASSDDGTAMFAVSGGVFYGRKLQLGLRMMLGGFEAFDEKSLAFASSFFIVRIPIKW